MKSLIKLFLALLVVFPQINYAQKKNIEDYFNEIPESVLKIKPENRKKILKSRNYQTAFENNVYFMLDTLDYRNGYLKISSIGDGEGEQYEVTYFNLSDGDKLIAINRINWAMCCDDSQVTFLRYNNGAWKDVSKQTILVDVLAEFIKDEAILKFVKEEFDGQLRYNLPQNGKNISVQFSETFYFYLMEPPEEGYKYSDEEINAAIKYNKMELLWRDGTFVKGTATKEE